MLSVHRQATVQTLEGCSLFVNVMHYFLSVSVDKVAFKLYIFIMYSIILIVVKTKTLRLDLC